MEEGNKDRNPTHNAERDSAQTEVGWKGIQRKRKGKARKSPTQWSTPKGSKPKNRTNHQHLLSPKQKKNNSPPTSNIHSGISVASSLIFSLILSLLRLSTALWLSLLLRRFSFASRACLSPTGCCPCCCVLVDPLVLRVPPRVLRKEEKHGTAGVAVLAELGFERVKHHREEAPSS